MESRRKRAKERGRKREASRTQSSSQSEGLFACFVRADNNRLHLSGSLIGLLLGEDLSAEISAHEIEIQSQPLGRRQRQSIFITSGLQLRAPTRGFAARLYELSHLSATSGNELLAIGTGSMLRVIAKTRTQSCKFDANFARRRLQATAFLGKYSLTTNSTTSFSSDALGPLHRSDPSAWITSMRRLSI